jgi:hypothetical protein
MGPEVRSRLEALEKRGDSVGLRSAKQQPDFPAGNKKLSERIVKLSLWIFY